MHSTSQGPRSGRHCRDWQQPLLLKVVGADGKIAQHMTRSAQGTGKRATEPDWQKTGTAPDVACT